MCSKASIPSPEPQTEIPTAKALRAEKYCGTITIAGRYTNPNPRPVNNKLIY